jgi:hypothetical protein
MQVAVTSPGAGSGFVSQPALGVPRLRDNCFIRAVAQGTLAMVFMAATPLPALRILEPVVIDGRLDDAAWAAARPVADFRQVSPDDGAVGSEKTEVRLLYDDKALYVGFRCFDSDPARIVARLARRDEDTASDRVDVALDTRGDHSGAFHFSVSAANVQRDAIRTGDDAFAWEWDAVWSSAVSLDGTGWSAELKIPLTALRFDSGAESTWRLQLGRFISRKNELQLWAYKPRSEFGELQRFRPIDGLSGFPAPHGLELRPFALLALVHRDAPGGINGLRGLAWRPSVGLDLRYGLTSGLSLDIAVLPDFGQVDADPALLNLTTFEVQLAERRPFFLESAELYRMRDAYGDPTFAQLFYSRRIGARPPLDSAAVDAPDVARIWGAAKLSGRVGEAVAIGLLDVVAAREIGTFTHADATPDRNAVAPLSNYAVARASAVLGGGVQAGFTFTDVHRAEEPGAMVLDGACVNTGEAPDAKRRCTRDVSAIEADLSFSALDGDLIGAAHVLGSRAHDGPSLALRDGTVIFSGDLGYGARAEIAKSSGLVVAHALLETYSPKLDLNEVGYLQRQNLHRIFTQLGIQFFNGPAFQKTKTAIEVFGRNSWDGAEILRGVNLNNLTEWNNFWTTWLEVQWSATAYENRELHDGTRFERPGLLGLEWSLTTNPANPLRLEASGLLTTTRIGTSVDTGLTLSAHATERLRISLTPSLLRVTGDIRHVGTDGSTYLFGLQDAVGTGLTLRSSVTFTPKMTLQLYAQLFLADVRYRELYRSKGEGTPRYVTLAMLEKSGGKPSSYDERDVTLNVNLVFRWEYLSGSVIYFLYTRSQGGAPAWADPDAPRPRIDFAGLGRVPIENVFMVKASYYFAR